MTKQEKDQLCEDLVQKMTTGDPLDDAEKSHLAGCEACMLQVVRTLDEAALSESHSRSMAASGSNSDLPNALPEAMKALEYGHRVFEREFGISLAKK